MKTHQNLTNENLKTIILNCGWQVEELEENTILASRNLRNVLLIDANEINVYDLTNADVVLMTNKAKEMIEEVLA